MRARTVYPRWYHAFRGFVIGTSLGALTMGLLIERGVIHTDTLAYRMLVPIVINGVSLVTLAACESYFAIQRYRRLSRRMDATAAQRVRHP